MLVVSGEPDLDRHDAGPGHPERPARLRAALAGVEALGLEESVVHLAPRRATREELTRVHRAGYLEALEALCAGGGGALDPDTVVGAGSFDTALLAAGATLAVVDALAQGRGEVGFVAARPPGHHATPERAMGFCLINNIAVAAARLADEGERVLIVDWDVHHGNGTEVAFWDDARVLYVSTHQTPLYPGSGRADDVGGKAARGLNVNVPLPAGATGDVVRRAYDEVAAPEIERFEPTWVLVSAGFDAHRADPLASLALTAGDFAALAREVARYAPRGGRLVFVLEGGYDLDAVKSSVAASLAAVLEVPFSTEQQTSGGPGDEAVSATKELRDRLGVGGGGGVR